MQVFNIYSFIIYTFLNKRTEFSHHEKNKKSHHQEIWKYLCENDDGGFNDDDFIK